MKNTSMIKVLGMLLLSTATLSVSAQHKNGKAKNADTIKQEQKTDLKKNEIKKAHGKQKSKPAVRP